MEENKYLCDKCKLEIEADSDFCPRCGTIFIEDVKCENHPDIEAKGVCVICTRPVCNNCGIKVNNSFFCNEHDSTEI